MCFHYNISILPSITLKFSTHPTPPPKSCNHQFRDKKIESDTVDLELAFWRVRDLLGTFHKPMDWDVVKPHWERHRDRAWRMTPLSSCGKRQKPGDALQNALCNEFDECQSWTQLKDNREHKEQDATERICISGVFCIYLCTFCICSLVTLKWHPMLLESWFPWRVP